MTPSTRARWAAVLDDFERSGLCVREFCDRRGISAQLLYRRRRELAAPAFVEARVAMIPSPAPIVVELPVPSPCSVPLTRWARYIDPARTAARIVPHAVGLPAKPGYAPRHATGRPPSGLTGKSRPRVPLFARFGANQPVAQGAARLCGRALGARGRARVPPRGCDSTVQPFIRIAANERTRTTLADGSYWQYVYDDLGEVSSGKRYSSTVLDRLHG